MKVLILGDLHFGARDDSSYFLERQVQFFEKNLFPYVKKHKIEAIIQLGDVFERRKFTNNKTLNIVNERVLFPLNALGIPVMFLIGNHDTYYKNTSKINTLSMFLHTNIFSNFTIIEEPTEWNKFLLIPWINSENAQQSIEAIKSNTTCQFCCGHFEIKTFLMASGFEAPTGISPSLFKEYEHVFSGHFHLTQQKDNIFYVGTPYALKWSDYGTHKHFIVFDTETKKITAVRNNDDTFMKFHWNERPTTAAGIRKMKNKIIKMLVSNGEPSKTSELLKYQALVDAVNPHSFEIVNNDNMMDDESTEELDVENTSKLIEQYFGMIQLPEDEREITRKTFLMLYHRAISRTKDAYDED